MRGELKKIISEAILEWEALEQADDLPIQLISLDEYITGKVMLWFERQQDRR